MNIITRRRGGREFAPVFFERGTPNHREYWVDISMNNPGPLFLGGDLSGVDNIEYYKRDLDQDDLKTSEGHVRCYYLDPWGAFKFAGVYCPYSKSVEEPGPMIGHEGLVHFARAGRLWCYAPQDYEDVQ